MAISSRLLSTGDYLVSNRFDEYTLPNSSYAASFNGSSKYLIAPASSTYNIGTSNFTIEAWVYFNTISASVYSTIGGVWVGAKQNWILQCISGNIQFATSTTGSNYVVLGFATTLTTGQWYHIAITGSSLSVRAFVNGTQVGTTQSITTIYGAGNQALYIGANVDQGPQQYLNGLISNFRFVKGTALYTAAFTPSISPLTAVTNTVLLTCQNPTIVDNSTNAFTITNTGSVTTSAVTSGASFTKTKSKQYPDGTFQTFSDIDEYTIPNSVYAASFNGSSQYLTIPSNAVFSFGTGDFTVEAWLYTGAPNGSYVNSLDKIVFGGFSASSPAFLCFLQNNTNQPAIWNGSNQYNSSIVVATNTWTHVAWTRNSGTLRIFVDGQLGLTQASYTTSFATNNTWYIGRDDTASVKYFPGNISNLRVVKGTALYTASFNPLTSPLTAIPNTVLLTCQNPTIVDNSTNAFTITNNGSVTTSYVPTSFYKGSFDGSSTFLTAPNNAAFNFGAGDFTVEAWVYLNSSVPAGSYPGIINLRSSYSTRYAWSTFISNNRFSFTFSSTGNGTTNDQGGTNSTTLSTGTWYHVAVCRVGTALYVSVNGNVESTTVTSSAIYNNTTDPLYIGRLDSGGVYFNGNISNVRIIKGTALYTSNFTPSKIQLTLVSGTSLLTLQSPTIIDNSINAFTITNNGPVTVQSPASFIKTKSRLFSDGSLQVANSFDEYTKFPPSSVDYLLVAGGGGGANGLYYQYEGGGGGAGGLLSGTTSIAVGTTYSFVVGAGGGPVSGGSNSTAFSLTAIGGGNGGNGGGGSGGSGGGTWNGTPGSGTAGPPRQGYNGAGGGSNPGGGGGASAAGITNGAGGAGAEWPTGSGTYYAGGGGGGYGGSSVGGGGGGGTSPTAGTVNTGGGGGAGISTNSSAGAGGGSGVVIVRYSNLYSDATSTTGSPTYTNTGGYKTYKFTSSGSITF